MQFLKEPQVIIIVLGLLFLGLCLVGVLFTVKSVKTSKGTEEKTFSSVGRIESYFEKAAKARTSVSFLPPPKNYCRYYFTTKIVKYMSYFLVEMFKKQLRKSKKCRQVKTALLICN